ncbi:hypothetical protein AX768_09265 [Burkholderia sp. PAMC 28687]|uniref:acyltransferase family protein n=1 Tax=Burkholderia sp. PAMC 28687 TaxID=1795874 RepID=UPI0007819899|nr:acyltransferase family protein [Burkholderia sp. PAMC 28687]AMM14257.1 hypothetical protein AX768_09265 [Burkholderia sp. PAMC 28687]
MKYRADVDGLRAVAVVSIVVFHLTARFLPGGFVGVDIFFVISGFLISKNIYDNVGAFSIPDFYIRRARRILPALIAVLIVSSACAAFLLYPSELVAYAKSVIASTLFSANIYFYSTLNYFSPNADEIPLLHLWSLGVEEQFYIFFPLIAVALAKRSMRLLTISLLLCAAVSLAASAWMLKSSPSAAFYLIPFRAFELLIGSIIALPTFRAAQPSGTVTVLSFVGVAALLWSILRFDNLTVFPGFAALLPCAGAALLIFSGEASKGFVARLLASRSFVYIGRISYSLYLVHWPILVFGKRAFPHADPNYFALSAIAASFLLAALSYHLVEQPFRHARRAYSGRTVFSISAASMCFIVLLGGCVIERNGFPGSVDSRTAKTLAYLSYDLKPSWKERTCFLDPEQIANALDVSSCLPHGEGRKVVLWGDSHAAQFAYGLEKTMAARGYLFGFMTASACAPAINYDAINRPNCRALNDIVFQDIVTMHPDIVIMTASWRIENNSQMDQLDETVKALHVKGINVVLLGVSPQFKQPLPVIVADRIKAGKDLAAAPEELELGYLNPTESYMEHRFANRPDVKYVSVMHAMCPDYKCPIVTADETPVHFDIAHLTTAGSDLYAKDLTPLILEAAANQSRARSASLAPDSANKEAKASGS